MKYEFKLPKKVKAKWVKALRSGKYLQAVSTLRGKIVGGRNDGKTGYCCLGVAREIGLTKKRSGQEFVVHTFLPDEIQGDLSSFNDVGEKSFKWIANYIEENL